MKTLNKIRVKPQLKAGERYKIDGKLYFIDEVTPHKTYAWRLDDNLDPYGRAVNVTLTKMSSVEKI